MGDDFQCCPILSTQSWQMPCLLKIRAPAFGRPPTTIMAVCISCLWCFFTRLGAYGPLEPQVYQQGEAPAELVEQSCFKGKVELCELLSYLQSRASKLHRHAPLLFTQQCTTVFPCPRSDFFLLLGKTVVAELLFLNVLEVKCLERWLRIFKM